MPSEQVPSDDPLGLDAVDRDIRINEANQELKALGMHSMHVGEDCPPELHEQFLQDILHIENGPVSTRFDQLSTSGVQLPAPDTLDDASLPSKLWEVIRALAEHDVFLYHTDHLSDRQLYEHLWSDSLREETTIMPPGSGWRCHLDLIGGGCDEDVQIGLKYYDSEEDCQHWAKEWPSDVIPPHEDPPFDRDRLLPVCDPAAPEPDLSDEE